MTLFEEILADILVEDVQVGKINDAISRSYAVKINYHSEHDDADGERIIQPVAYGLTKSGKPVIRAYQPMGDTKTTVPAWKFFLVSGIQSWKPMFKQVFHAPPADNFNPNGDKTMSVVYKVAKFLTDPNKETIKQPTPVKADGPVKKTDIEKPRDISVKNHPEVKKLEKLKKQLEKPKKYIWDVNPNVKKPEDKENAQKMTATSGPVSKDEMENSSVKNHPEVKKLEKLKKQLDNPTYISDIIKNKTFGADKSEEENERMRQNMMNQWQKEQEKRKNRNGSIRNGIE